MKKALVLLAALGLFSIAPLASAEEKAKNEEFKGVLIDAKCGGDKNEEAVAKHPKACAVKCAGGGEALVLKSGDKTIKMDEASAKKALEYLKKEETKSTKVIVVGHLHDGVLMVDSIKPQEEKKG
jgi:ribosomal protein S27E